MLQQIVGGIDWPAAVVLVVFFGGIAVSINTLLIRRQTKAEVQLDLIKQKNEQDVRLYNAETQRGIETKRLDQNLITSHKES